MRGLFTRQIAAFAAKEVNMTTLTLSETAQKILAALPTDGKALGNTALVKALAVEKEAYFAARKELLVAKQVETGRGRGGSLRRLVQA